MDIIQRINIDSITFNKNKSIVVNKEKFLIEDFNEDSNNIENSYKNKR